MTKSKSNDPWPFVRVAITLPPPPSINHYYRNLQSGTVISKAGRAFRKDVAYLVLAALDRRQLPLKGRLKVRVRYCPADNRRRDIDNVLKPLLGAMLKAGVYKDDEQVDDLRILRGPCSPGGKVEVVILQFPEEVVLRRAPTKAELHERVCQCGVLMRDHDPVRGCGYSAAREGR
ncbi:MAG: RusA family crossover junction endodeoxyribonuclease [Gemmataceae bacterium]